MNIPKWIRPLFLVAALYDAILGGIFLVAPEFLFDYFGVTPANHMGYVQFPAAILLIFGWMFWNIAQDAAARREQIVYGILLKAAYCGVAGWYWATRGIPFMWKPFVVADLLMGIAFVAAYRSLARR